MKSDILSEWPISGVSINDPQRTERSGVRPDTEKREVSSKVRHREVSSKARHREQRTERSGVRRVRC